jgi:hypothetical protein
VLKKMTKSIKTLKEKQKVLKEETKSNPTFIGDIVKVDPIFLKVFKYGCSIKAKNWQEKTDLQDPDIDSSFLHVELSTRVSYSKSLISKLQSMIDILQANLTIDTKQQKETSYLKAEGSKLIYEILIGKSFEIDAFQMKDPEVQRMRSDQATSSESMLKKHEGKSKDKTFINIFKPQEGISVNQNINLKKIPIKSIKRVTGVKQKTQKFVDAPHSSSVMLYDENVLLALNHLINYHYLLSIVSFDIRSHLTLSEDSLFIYTSYM